MPSLSSLRRPSLVAFARWSVGLVVLVLLGVNLNVTQIMKSLQSADPLLACAGIGGLTAMHLLGAVTWRRLCVQLAGVRLGWRAVLSWYYAAQALGGVTPANLGGDAFRVYQLRTAGHRFEASVAPVVVQRATSYLALSVLGVLALAVLASSAEVAIEIVLAALLISTLASILAALLLVPSVRLAPVRARFAGIFGGSAFQVPGALRGSGRQLAVAVGTGVLLGLAFHAGAVLFTYLLVLSVLPTAVFVPTAAALAVARLSLSIPITPSGLGVQEAALSVLFVSLGMPPASAVAALLLSRLALLLTTVVGVIALAGQRGPRAVGVEGSTA